MNMSDSTSKMNLLLFLSIVYALVQTCLSMDKNCNMTIVEADKCAKQLMFIGDRDNIIPANEQEMQTYCDQTKAGIRCIRHFARSCLPPFPQQVFGMFAYDAKNVLRRQCKTPNDRTVFIKHVSCFLPKPAMDPLHLCMDRYVIDLDAIKQVLPDWRIAGTCCAFHLFQECIQKSTQSVCESKTGVETVDYIMNIINSMTDDVMDFTCGQFDSKERCAQHLDPDLWSKLSEVKSADQVIAERAQHKYFSPVPLLVSVISNYEM